MMAVIITYVSNFSYTCQSLTIYQLPNRIHEWLNNITSPFKGNINSVKLLNSFFKHSIALHSFYMIQGVLNQIRIIDHAWKYLPVYTSQASPMQFGFSAGLGSNFILMASQYNLHPTQIPKAVSRNKRIRQIMQRKQTGSKREASSKSIIDNTKIAAERPNPKLHANLF